MDPIFSDSRDPMIIFSDARDPNRVLKKPCFNINRYITVVNLLSLFQ